MGKILTGLFVVLFGGMLVGVPLFIFLTREDRAAISPPAPPPPVASQDPILLWTPDGTPIWAPNHDPEAQSVQVYFDNGGPSALTVRVADAFDVAVPSAEHRMIFTRPGTLRFVARGVDGAAIDDETHALEPHHSYLYNPGATWAYILERESYSTLAAGGGLEPFSRRLSGVFIDLGEVDKAWEPLPESVDVQTFHGIGGTSLTAFRHAADAPASGCTVRRATAGDNALRIIACGARVEVLPVAAATNLLTESTLFVDNASAEVVNVEIDGASVANVAKGALLTLALLAGEHSIRAIGKAEAPIDSVSAAFGADARYAWTPLGRREYRIEYRSYGHGGSEKKPELLRPKGLFSITADYAFEAFPKSVRGSMALSIEKSRIERGKVVSRR